MSADMTEHDYDVAIVGYGPVGQTAAILLGLRGYRVGVFERRPALYPLPRAVHYDDEIARIFQAIGVAEQLADRVEPISLYEWRNAAGQTLMALDTRRHGPSGWPMGTMFSQPDLEAVLDRAAKALASVEVHQGWEVAQVVERDEQVTLELREGRTEGAAWVPTGGRARAVAHYVIGADGANSLVRDAMGVTVTDLGFTFDWLIADVVPGDPATLAGVNLQICDPARPTTMVSGGPGRRRWEWMLLPGETPEAVSDEGWVWSQLARHGVAPGNARLERFALYTFRARWADSWRRGRLLLAGDAAHQMPPFAGQGMCSGLRDAMSLAWRLDLHLAGRASAAALDAYTSERLAHLQQAIGISVELGKLICVADPAAAAVRDTHMLAARADESSAPPSPPSPTLGPGLLRPGDPAAGTLLPQGTVAVDGRVGRFDDLVGRGFVLLQTAPAALDAPDLRFFASIGGLVVHVTPQLDVDGTYREWLAGHESAAALVRPDFYVFGTAASPDQTPRLVRDLDAALTFPGGDQPARREPFRSAPGEVGA